MPAWEGVGDVASGVESEMGWGAGKGSRQSEGYPKRQLRHGPVHAVWVVGLKLVGKSTGGWTDREVLPAMLRGWSGLYRGAARWFQAKEEYGRLVWGERTLAEV